MRWLLLLFPVLLLVSCENGSSSSVPFRPVGFQLDVRTFTTMKPDMPNSYVIVNAGGFYEGTNWRMGASTAAYGFAGVVVFVSINTTNPYLACDLCCPHCMSSILPCEMDGMYAVCPICGERYDMNCSAVPTKGIAREPLKRYSVLYSYPMISVSN